MRYLPLLMLVAWPLFMSKTSLASELAETMVLYAEQGQHNRIQSPFNGVMLVAKNNNILLKKAYGFYDKERNKLLKTNSKFLIGSVTKQFTAMLVLQQVALGNIELDKNVSDYLPVFPYAKGKELTIHRLLTHTSGLPHYEGLRRLDMNMEEFYRKKFTPKSYAQLISNMKLINQPGREFYYSSFNYILLGAILEQVTGQTFQNLLERHIIKPLGLKIPALLIINLSKNTLRKAINFRNLVSLKAYSHRKRESINRLRLENSQILTQLVECTPVLKISTVGQLLFKIMSFYPKN